MKLSGKKDMSVERLSGRERLDEIMIPRLNKTMGPKFALYQAKAWSASSADTMLAPEESAIDIQARFAILLDEVSAIEAKRQAFQARIDNAITALEIDEIVKEASLDG